uniref:Kelch-like family member 7 n=1 Tax=Sinocyclocheilus grahami TaxID=75366 RepID=A0A672KXM0_SINGR
MFTCEKHSSCGAEPEIIELLVEFVFTARISVNSNNVQSLLNAANQYQVKPVKKMCVDFLKEQVDATSCLGISTLAECLNCPELKVAADDFIHQHFTDVYKMDELLQLDVKQVMHLLQQDTLTVRAEDQVPCGAVAEVRQQYIVGILGKVRFPLVSKNVLSKTVQAELLIQDNPECLKMVISPCGMCSHLLPPEGREELAESSRRKHDYRIALFGGSQPQSCRYFNPKDYSWTDIRCPFEKRRDAASVFFFFSHYEKKTKFLQGNSSAAVVMSSVDIFTLNTSGKVRKGQCGVFMICYGDVSLSGGLDSVEYYEMGSNEWKMTSLRPWRGVTVKCAAVGSVIYVLAGFQGVGRLGHIMEYYTETDKWVVSSKVCAFPVTSCLICLVDTCGANEEDMSSTSSSSSS